MMKASLMKKLSFGFISTILGSIILTSLMSNYSVGKEFKKFLMDEHKIKIANVIKVVQDSYSIENNFSSVKAGEIQRYAELQELFIEIKDINNNTIYSSGDSHLKHKSMMENMMGSMMQNFAGTNVGEYTEKQYPLTSADNQIGIMTVGYFGTSFMSTGSITFVRALNLSFLLSALIAMLFGLIVSIIISKQLTKPLVKITHTANKIRAGNLEVRSQVNTNTNEICELSNSINYLAETLSKQEMLRKRLTSDMAHELRTPLATLKTHVEAFMDGIWEPTPERYQVFYDEIERLTKMVDNLRNLSKLEEANLNLNKSSTNVSIELEKIIDSFKPMFIKENNQIVSKIQPEVVASVDRDKLNQIVTNLISNSFKHLKAVGKVVVELKEENAKLIIHVKDNGIGIPEKDLPYIFERFYRSDLSRNRNTGGSGIGLTITKAFVEAHGGKIYAQSKVDEGTIFTIEIPKISS